MFVARTGANVRFDSAHLLSVGPFISHFIGACRDPFSSRSSVCRSGSVRRSFPFTGAVMTRRDYEVIARVIREMPTTFPRERVAKQEYARAFADALTEGNPAFNRERFLSACMGE